MSQSPQSRLLLVDGHAYAYRSFHAIRSLNAPDGTPTNALFGFIKALQKVIAITAPSHVLVVWDGGLDAARCTHVGNLVVDDDGAERRLRQAFPAHDHGGAGKRVAREHGGEGRRGLIQREERERHLGGLGRLARSELEPGVAHAEAGGQGGLGGGRAGRLRIKTDRLHLGF